MVVKLLKEVCVLLLPVFFCEQVYVVERMRLFHALRYCLSVLALDQYIEESCFAAGPLSFLRDLFFYGIYCLWRRFFFYILI